MNIYEQINKNKRSTRLFLLIFSLLFLLIGLGADHYYGTGAQMPVFTLGALGGSIAVSFSGYFYGDRLILNSTHAHELDFSDLKQKQWQNIIEEMSIASGIPVPKTYLVDDADPNAFATGRNPQHASLAVTRGLLEVLSREELQAVAAHEMSHIRNYDVRLMLIVAVLAGSVALLADWARRMTFRGGQKRGNSNGKSNGPAAVIFLAVWIVSLILAPLVSRLVAMCVSRRREYLADASGAELTRNPLALAKALEKISACAGPTESIHQGSAHLCIADPLGSALNNSEGWFSELFGTHPPIGQRIARLKEMSYISQPQSGIRLA